jgi:IS5 family transposase
VALTRENGLKPLGKKGLRPFLLRTVADQPTLWDAVLPEELRRLPAELARIDVLLDDPVFFAPFVRFFDPDGRAVDTDGDLPAVDVPQVPIPLGV